MEKNYLEPKNTSEVQPLIPGPIRVSNMESLILQPIIEELPVPQPAKANKGRLFLELHRAVS